MLFNSFGFIFLFMPVVAIVFFAIGRSHRTMAILWLAAASIFFYGWSHPPNVAILLLSIAVNYAAGLWLAKTEASTARSVRKWIPALAIGFDLAFLAYFKYANFIVANIADLTGAKLVSDIHLPIGISFFTFTQIAFLVDVYQGKAKEYRLADYGLFVSYFPHLIAGPILHHGEMMPQFREARIFRVDWRQVAIGVSVFLVGLFKKVMLADNVAPISTSLFDAAAAGHPISLGGSWAGVLAYTLQIYFDFSGYSDMAIGLSFLFGIRLPINFNSPYRAVSIIDFWRRWHMTLSRFLRDYLYIPLGGNRKGRSRRYVNLMLTMILGGLWHGAGFTFLAWGALHGLYLVVNHAWRATIGGHVPETGTIGAISRNAGWLVTLLAVMAAWVFFRAPSFPIAAQVLESMSGLGHVPLLLSGERGRWAGDMALLLPLLAACRFLPNSLQLFEGDHPYLGQVQAVHGWIRFLGWRPSLVWASALAIAGIVSAERMLTNGYSEFLYFQF